MKPQNIKLPLLLAFLFIAFKFAYFFLLSDHIRITVHDNLDSSFVWLKLLKTTGVFFNFESTVPFLGGMSRNYFPSSFQVANLLYFFFPPLIAYHVSTLIAFLLGSISFYLLANKMWGSPKNKILLILVSFAYACLPGYPELAIAQATVPLVFYLVICFINTEGKNRSFGSLLLLYPCLSEFPRYGIFIISYLAFAFFFYIFSARKKASKIFIAIFLLSLGYLIFDYPFFKSLVFSETVSVRKLMLYDKELFFSSFIKGFLFGQYHAQSLHTFLILPLVIFLVIKFYKGKNFKQLELFIFLLILINSFIYALSSSGIIRNIVYMIEPLKGWNFGRTIWFNPVLWYLLFYRLLIKIQSIKKKLKIEYIALAQILYVLFKPSLYNDLNQNLKCNYQACLSNPTFHDFYSSELFKHLKKFIHYNNELVLTFGVHPSVLTYNNFYTLDGYHNAYPETLKKDFRKIIEPELRRSEELRRYYDDWGGRVYLFSAEYPSIYKPGNVQIIKGPVTLNINSLEAKNKGVVYLISFVEILNAQELLLKNLSFPNSGKDSYYKIYVYKFL